MNASPDIAGFRAFQSAFAARIRDPRGQPRPQGVPLRRMRVYEELLFNNLEGFLLACFPITRTLLGARTWRKTARRFFVEHRCSSPLFRDIPGEFLAWMETEAMKASPERPYLYEFMHYEWLELQVSISPDETDSLPIDPSGDLLSGIPMLNPTTRMACYQYPVHRIGPRSKPAEADGRIYCYLVYRDVQDAVRFIELNPVAARLWDLMCSGHETGYEILSRLAVELDHRHHETIVETGHALLEELRRSGAVLGTRSTT